jgi:predicted transcriptional regulator
MPEILNWLAAHADEDGFITISTKRIATELKRPRSTVQHALKRAEDTGVVVQFSPGRYAVVHLAQDEE